MKKILSALTMAVLALSFNSCGEKPTESEYVPSELVGIPEVNAFVLGSRSEGLSRPDFIAYPFGYNGNQNIEVYNYDFVFDNAVNIETFHATEAFEPGVYEFVGTIVANDPAYPDRTTQIDLGKIGPKKFYIQDMKSGLAQVTKKGGTYTIRVVGESDDAGIPITLFYRGTVVPKLGSYETE